jgi:hypothetical protein
LLAPRAGVLAGAKRKQEGAKRKQKSAKREPERLFQPI